uniref:G-protein coupled receptors family 1 profile domain-containing protein n=1 Tax=Parascaris univalens TaxID=6257 RepID=A0A915C0B3_PARUN
MGLLLASAQRVLHVLSSYIATQMISFRFEGVVYPETLVMKGGKLMVIVQILSQVLAYTNSCLNPILYAFLSDNFRKGFMRILTVTINICTLGWCCTENRETGPLNLTHCNNGALMGSRHQSLIDSASPLIRIRISTQTGVNETSSLLRNERISTTNTTLRHVRQFGRLSEVLVANDVGNYSSSRSGNLNGRNKNAKQFSSLLTLTCQ